MLPKTVSNPVALAISPARRGMALSIAGLIVTACFVRWLFAPRLIAEDPLRGDPESVVGALATKMGTLSATEQDVLLKRYMNDPSPGLRYAAVDRLGEINRSNSEVAVLLEAAYTDSSSIVRQSVLENLPNIDPKRGVHLLLAALRDEDSWMREAAIMQIKYRVRAKNSPLSEREERMVPSLIAALDDSDSVVSSTAVNVLKTVTGNAWIYRTTAPDAQKAAVHRHWKTWWANQQTKGLELLPVDGIKPERSDPAPQFTLTDIDGKAVSLAAQRGRATLLNFWGTWCLPCQKEIPDLTRLDREYRSRGVDIVGIAVGERSGKEGLKKWCGAHGITYRQTLAVENVLHDFGDIHEVPVSVLIDGKGRIRRRWEGERDFETFRAALDDVLHE